MFAGSRELVDEIKRKSFNVCMKAMPKTQQAGLWNPKADLTCNWKASSGRLDASPDKAYL
jgi:hypothetical protein